MTNKTLPVLKRIALVVLAPVWLPLAFLVYMLMGICATIWGILVWFGTGKNVFETAEDLWAKWLMS